MGHKVWRSLVEYYHFSLLLSMLKLRLRVRFVALASTPKNIGMKNEHCPCPRDVDLVHMAKVTLTIV